MLNLSGYSLIFLDIWGCKLIPLVHTSNRKNLNLSFSITIFFSLRQMSSLIVVCIKRLNGFYVLGECLKLLKYHPHRQRENYLNV